MKLLIVDNDNDHTMTFQEFFIEKGYKCQVAFNGKEALEILRKESFDLILLDLDMPGLSGLETMEIIKERNYNEHIYIITGLENAPKFLYYKNGCILFERKPVDIIELEYKIRNFLRSIQEKKGLRLQENSHIEMDIHHIYEFILENLSNPQLNASLICEHFKINKNQLYNRINEILTVSVHDIIKNLRMLKAKELISNKKYKTIKALSEDVGYQDSGYFSKLYKKAFERDIKQDLRGVSRF